MLTVKIEAYTEMTETMALWHNLMTRTGIQEAYQHLDKIFETGNDYVITDVQTDWARYDHNTTLDDMVDTVNVLHTLMKDEVTLFKTLYYEGIHEPLDIACQIRDSEMKYIEDVDEDDEIWEIVYLDKKQTKIAILY